MLQFFYQVNFLFQFWFNHHFTVFDFSVSLISFVLTAQSLKNKIQNPLFTEISGSIQQWQKPNQENQFASLVGPDLQALYYFSFVQTLLLCLLGSYSGMELSVPCCLLQFCHSRSLIYQSRVIIAMQIRNNNNQENQSAQENYVILYCVPGVL